MSEPRCGIIELAPDNEAAIKEWLEYMESHRDGVRKVFEQAGIELESFFLTSIGGKDYLISYLRILDAEKAHEAHVRAYASDSPTTRANERFKQAVWRTAHEARLLFDLVT